MLLVLFFEKQKLRQSLGLRRTLWNDILQMVVGGNIGVSRGGGGIGQLSSDFLR